MTTVTLPPAVLEAIRGLVSADDTGCDPDHHGYCQAHRLGDVQRFDGPDDELLCETGLVQRWLAELDAVEGDPGIVAEARLLPVTEQLGKAFELVQETIELGRAEASLLAVCPPDRRADAWRAVAHLAELRAPSLGTLQAWHEAVISVAHQLALTGKIPT